MIRFKVSDLIYWGKIFQEEMGHVVTIFLYLKTELKNAVFHSNIVGHYFGSSEIH